MKRNILITGGAGFIGSHVVRLFVNKYPEYHIINLDKLTYAGNLANLKDIEGQEYLGRVDFKWIFEAAIKKEVTMEVIDNPTSDSNTPNTGYGNTILIIFSVILFINAVFVGLMTRRCRKDGTNGGKEK